MEARTMQTGWSSVSGIVTHSYQWLMTKGEDITFQNPNFEPAGPDDAGIAIYCIHGTADRVGAFVEVARGILGCLPSSVAAIHLISFHSRGFGCGIPSFANQLKNKISLNPHRDVILMGHSRGGAVAAYFEVNLSRQAGIRVLAVMGICSPFKGSHLALPPFTFWSESVRQMQEKSDFLEELAAGIKQSDAKYCYYTAGQDAIVAPENGVLPENCFSCQRFNQHGHLSIMSSLQLMEQLLIDIYRIQGEMQPALESLEAGWEKQFEWVSNQTGTMPLDEMCMAISGQMQCLSSGVFWYTARLKLAVLSQLMGMLQSKAFEVYPAAVNVGEWIETFLGDKQWSGVSDWTPRAILCNSLGLFGARWQALFFKSSSQTDVFISNLIEQGKALPLPVNQVELKKR
ncbi:MAG: hypothetical protein A3E85_05010 [Gammaproteobacteria bacterium RIFCSPHIGHO2_12_FULL_45_12]|nr:MAG: hypothetical protein A3E85_05010 [Gammaproteobacteria bacterium RIFCSPHIGHO2_12_FULL_45_12]